MKKGLCIYAAVMAAAVMSVQQSTAQSTNVVNGSPYWSLDGNSNATTSSKLGTTNNIPLRIVTNNTERIRVLSTGNVGIGTTIPAERLHVNSAAGANAFRAQVNGSTKLLVHGGGGVSIGSPSAPPANGLFVSGNSGFGTTAPDNKVHILKGSAGSVTGFVNAPLIVENSVHSYINILAPDAQETGILFGKPANSISGGIVYSNASTTNGFQFRTNGNITRMILNSGGQLGVGTLDPQSFRAKFSHGGFGVAIENTSSGDDWELVTFTSGLNFYLNGSFKGLIRADNGNYQPSDQRLKSNIKPIGTMLEKINKLKPSTYTWKDVTDNKEHIGFIAQEVMEVFPSMVFHNVNAERNLDVYTLDYKGFGVVAIKGIQELQGVIGEQRVKIEELEKKAAEVDVLKQRLSKLEALLTNRGNGGVSLTSAYLEQNIPNPVSGTTTIRYTVPETATSARLTITNAKGQVVRTININNKGTGQQAFNTSALPAGTYNYTLFVDGKQTDTKRLVVVR